MNEMRSAWTSFSAACAVALALAGAAAVTAAQEAAAPNAPTTPQQHVKIGFVEVENDARYAPILASDRIVLKMPAHPFAGAEIGIDEAAPLTRLLDSAPLKDEEITAEEEAAVQEAREELAAGVPTIPLEEVKHKHGLR